MKRGEIYNVERKQQINDFSNMLYGTITPTDIDGLIEYKNLAYIFFEVKYKDTELPLGQKIALERLIIDLNKANKPSICIIAMHFVSDVKVKIDVSTCIVRKIFDMNFRWRDPKYKTVKKTIEKFIDYVEILNP